MTGFTFSHTNWTEPNSTGIELETNSSLPSGNHSGIISEHTAALSDLISFSFYIITGTFMVSGNGLILWIVARNKGLRKKEYIIPAGLAFGDFFYGLGNVAAGTKRLYLVLTHRDVILVTAWHCVWEPWNLFWIFGCQMMTLMMVFVSIDRFIATSSVSTYMKLGIDYALKGIAIIATYCSCSLVVAVMTAFFLPRDRKFKSICITTWAVSLWYSDYHFFHQSICGVVCIFIYIGIIIQLKRDSAKIEHDKIKAEFKRRQLKVTKMLTFVISSGFFIHDVPNFLIFIISHFEEYFGSIFHIWVPILWVISSFSSANNIIIYMVKNRDIRAAAWNIVGSRWITSAVTPGELSTNRGAPVRRAQAGVPARRVSDARNGPSVAFDRRGTLAPVDKPNLPAVRFAPRDAEGYRGQVGKLPKVDTKGSKF